MFEPLEFRRHFSVVCTQDSGTLSVTGSDDPDDVSIDVDGDTVTVACDGQTSVYYRVVEVQCDTSGGDDRVSVTLENATPRIAIETGDGNDVVNVSGDGAQNPAPSLVLATDSGDDLIDCSSTAVPADVTGGEGDDTLIGSAAADSLAGGSGNDQILGMGGGDVIAAGSGANYVSAPGNGSVFLSADVIDIGPVERDDYAPQIVETYPGFYEITGDWHADRIAILISQADGTFTFNGTTYADASFVTVNTNGGNDFVSVSSNDGDAPIGVSVNTGDGDDVVNSNVDGSIDGGDGDDQLNMQDVTRAIVHGGAGNDSIKLGGASAECSLFGDDGRDLIDASGSPDAVEARGGAGDDTIYGSQSGDALYGEAGNDHIFGLAGADLIDGGTDYDSLDGGDGGDVFYAASNWTVVGGGGNDTLYAFVLDGTSSGVEHVYQRNQ
jgi:Ca2+-binding RTX toxin-like protein